MNNLEIDFKSLNNLSAYGSKIWYLIHTFAAHYSPDKAMSFIAFIVSLRELIPCQLCRIHFKEHLPKLDVMDYLSDANHTFLWTYLIHDIVNTSRQEKYKNFSIVSPSFETMKSIYFKNGISNYLPKLFYTLFTFTANYNPQREKYFLTFIVVTCNLLPSSMLQSLFKNAITQYSFKNVFVDENNLSVTHANAVEWCYKVYSYLYSNIGMKPMCYDAIKTYFIIENV